MVEINQSHVQRDIRRVLFERATAGNWTDASLTRPRISELLGYKIAPAMVQIHLDELVEQKLVQSPKRGVRDRFQITGHGIQEYDSLSKGPRSKDILGQNRSRDLNGSSINEAKAIKIFYKIKLLQGVLEGTELTNEQKAKAGAMIAAAAALAEAPEPPWEVIKDILLILSGIATVFVGALEIVKLIG